MEDCTAKSVTAGAGCDGSGKSTEEGAGGRKRAFLDEQAARTEPVRQLRKTKARSSRCAPASAARFGCTTGSQRNEPARRHPRATSCLTTRCPALRVIPAEVAGTLYSMRLGSALAFGLLPILACGTGCHKRAQSRRRLCWHTGYAKLGAWNAVRTAAKGLPDPTPEPGQSKIQRIQETLPALDASALHAAVDIKVGDHLLPATSDDRGYLEVTLPAKLVPPAVPVEIHLRTPGYDAAATCRIDPGLRRQRRVWRWYRMSMTRCSDPQITDKSKMVKSCCCGTWELGDVSRTRCRCSQPVWQRQAGVRILSGNPWAFNRPNRQLLRGWTADGDDHP